MQSTSAMNSQIYTHTELNTMAPPRGQSQSHQSRYEPTNEARAIISLGCLAKTRARRGEMKERRPPRKTSTSPTLVLRRTGTASRRRGAGPGAAARYCVGRVLGGRGRVWAGQAGQAGLFD